SAGSSSDSARATRSSRWSWRRTTRSALPTEASGEAGGELEVPHDASRPSAGANLRDRLGVHPLGVHRLAVHPLRASNTEGGAPAPRVPHFSKSHSQAGAAPCSADLA